MDVAIYGKKRDYAFHELFEESKILTVYELYCFELIKFSLKSLRLETPSSITYMLGRNQFSKQGTHKWAF